MNEKQSDNQDMEIKEPNYFAAALFMIAKSHHNSPVPLEGSRFGRFGYVVLIFAVVFVGLYL